MRNDEPLKLPPPQGRRVYGPVVIDVEADPEAPRMMTAAAEIAHTLAYSAGQEVDRQRRLGVEKATGFLLAGKPGRALYELVRSVERQNRIAGGGTVPIVPTCGCGGRCPHGVSGVAS